MKVIVVLIQDRHADPAVYVFTPDKLEAALEFARGEALVMARGDQSDVNAYLNNAMKAQGWLWFASVGPEGDSVRVEEVELR